MSLREDLEELFPVWSKLSSEEKEILVLGCAYQKVEEGAILHNGSSDCIGLVLIKSGRLRTYILNENGREITLYRLFERDICLFSASCMMRSIQFEVSVEAEKSSEVLIISPPAYEKLMSVSLAVSNYTNQLISSRFSEVMWLIEQIMFKSFDVRLAEFLYEQCNIEGNETIAVTHEKIARHLGTAREVVTRMLKYFQSEGIVRLFRGGIEIINREGLVKIMDKT